MRGENKNAVFFREPFNRRAYLFSYLNVAFRHVKISELIGEIRDIILKHLSGHNKTERNQEKAYN
ncbi:MAG: hypothetical protein BWY46_01667 [Firmicutes bacterium ADurb.Bin300]|nr:MAG: hypothetical protein BWY46_01667 [Firmicutes bacterium ADurb.Bin300]